MATADSSDSGSFGGDFIPSELRVLVVDDDMVCLRYLESLLRKCHYQVTGTSQALGALQILREKKGEFDLVMSDVNMPDMDGFKLLEHVEFEMDIPVIMVSSHSEKELVYKGVTHGAVDYLLKPVRMEEVKNIWQHVVRKRKMSAKNKKSKSSSSPEQGNHQDDNNSGPPNNQGTSAPSSGNSDPNGGKSSKKRKDNEGDEEDGGHNVSDENGREENEESGTQKKARVVWNPQLHKKFVEAVYQIGFDKAVPKKILEMMDVEGLTRENVASHLQKFRMYLKKAGNIGRLPEVDELRYVPRFPGGYQPAGRYNSPSNLIPRRLSTSLPSSGIIIQQQTNLLNNIAEQMQQHQQPSSVFPSGESSMLFPPKHISFNNSTGFLGSSSSSNIRVAPSSSPNSMMMLQPAPPHNIMAGGGGAFGGQQRPLNQPSPFGLMHHGSSSNFDAVQLPKLPPTSFDFSTSNLMGGNVIDDYSPSILNSLNNPFGAMNSLTGSSNGVTSATSASGPLNMSVFDNAIAGGVTQTHNGCNNNNYDYLDDMMTALIKREQNEGLIIDPDLGLDAYQMGPSPHL